jgi:AcrR family transcriptional regulator
MRVTSETKAATRQTILDVARQLFVAKGFDATTTRDIAQAAGIATGTLFNYFPTKEAVLACLAAEAGAEAIEAVAARPEPAGTVEEDLFVLVAATLRTLKPLRKHLPALLESALSPLASAAPSEAESLRTRHLEAAAALAARHGHRELSPVALQLYWTLYTGVLVFWANDTSPRLEDTLALIDESLDMYATWLRGTRPAGPDATDKEPPCPRSPN